ncbi:MAG: hypothetical protein JWQ87_2851 [Candidatus Sulfotelmatobacter sp.]|nr:hypothetical protein [Candidatus Sulfotelmatobacter sp.]
MKINLLARAIMALFCLTLISLFSRAQENTPPPPAKQKDKAAQGVSVPDKNAGTSNDRLFYTLPNFLSLENGGQVPPLTTAQKFKVVARGSFDPVVYPWYGFLAAISQAENSEPGYGQGWGGYGKRYGAAFADGTIENFITGAILPSALHQDPRYFQLGHGSFMHRSLYAISRNLVTRTDSGGEQFNYSEIVGGGMSAFISTYSYHPSADKTVSNALSVWATQYAYDTITIVVKEFWPDIHRKLSHKNQVEAPAAVSAKP